MEDRYVNGQNKILALRRTLIEDSDHKIDNSRGNDRCHAPESLAMVFKAFLLHHAAFWVLEARKIEALRDGSSPSEAILASLDDISMDDVAGLVRRVEEIRHFPADVDMKYASMDDEVSEHLKAYRPYWSFFRADEGLMGMGPPSLHVDNPIRLVPGAEVLFVLRARPPALAAPPVPSSTPALQPPPGVTLNFVNPASRTPGVLVATAVITAVMLQFVLARVYAKIACARSQLG
ncbi:MAG: hypothetical protein Q9173_005480 [Seirophora scorigena]